MSRTKKQKHEYALVPLLEMGNNKLAVSELKHALLDDCGHGTAAFNYFGFNTWNENFFEKDNSQKYALQAEIWTDKGFYYVVGQSGLFLKVDKAVTYEKVEEAKLSSKKFADFCESYLFSPIGIAHISDGDYYIREGYDYNDCVHAKFNIELFETNRR